MDNQMLNYEQPNTSKTNSTRPNVMIAEETMVKLPMHLKCRRQTHRVNVSTFQGCTTLRPIL